MHIEVFRSVVPVKVDFRNLAGKGYGVVDSDISGMMVLGFLIVP